MQNFKAAQALTNKALIEQLKSLVSDEKSNILSQIPLIRELFERQIHLRVGYSNFAVFCEEKLGISKNQAWKRCQAAMITRAYPSVREMLEKGETTVSCVAMLCPKITQANEKAIIEGIRGKNNKEAQFFLSTINHSGERIDREPTVEIRIELTKEQLAKLERARRILGQNRTEISNADVLEEALDLLLSKRDPMIKAQMVAEKKGAKSAAPEKLEDCTKQAHESCLNLHQSEESCPKQTSSEKFGQGIGQTRYIPVDVRRQVFLRDEGRCTFVSKDGRRCEETLGLQLDHITMFCRGGAANVENLRIVCKNHNIFLAKEALGREYMR
jgi:5-methylcytosine-specific restriction endonuclease McrA